MFTLISVPVNIIVLKSVQTKLSLLTGRFKSGTNSHWLQVLEGSGIPYGQVNDIPEVFRDPQVCIVVLASINVVLCYTLCILVFVLKFWEGVSIQYTCTLYVQKSEDVSGNEAKTRFGTPNPKF